MYSVFSSALRVYSEIEDLTIKDHLFAKLTLEFLSPVIRHISLKKRNLSLPLLPLWERQAVAAPPRLI